MNEVLNNILTRRSIRNYQDTPVPRALTEEVVKAGIWAPSGKNQQTCRFFVTSDAARMEPLIKAIGTAMDNPAYTFYGAKTIVLVSTPKDAANGVSDGSAAIENMLLAAHALGLGGCWINQLKYVGDETEVRRVMTACGIPETHQVVGIVALGYPAEDGKVNPRLDGLVTWLDGQ